MIVFLLTLLLGASVMAQSRIVQLYYNANWQLTHPSNTRYIRVTHFDSVRQQFTGEFKDLELGNKLLLEGQYSDNGEPEGLFKYYENGQIVKRSYYENGELNKVEYYRDSLMWQEVLIEGNDFVVNTFVDSTGYQLIRNGTGPWYLPQPQNTIVEGRFERGKKTGTWRYRKTNGEIILQENWKKGKFKNGFFFSRGVAEDLTDPAINASLFQDQVLARIERFEFDANVSADTYPFLNSLPKWSLSYHYQSIQPADPENFSEAQFPGGMQNLYNWIAQRLNYPARARKEGIQGVVYVKLSIDREGNPGNYQVIKGINPLVDQAALDTMQNMPEWKPARQGKEPVASYRIIPVTFRSGI